MTLNSELLPTLGTPTIPICKLFEGRPSRIFFSATAVCLSPRTVNHRAPHHTANEARPSEKRRESALFSEASLSISWTRRRSGRYWRNCGEARRFEKASRSEFAFTAEAEKCERDFPKSAPRLCPNFTPFDAREDRTPSRSVPLLPRLLLLPALQHGNQDRHRIRRRQVVPSHRSTAPVILCKPQLTQPRIRRIDGCRNRSSRSAKRTQSRSVHVSHIASHRTVAHFVVIFQKSHDRRFRRRPRQRSRHHHQVHHPYRQEAASRFSC